MRRSIEAQTRMAFLLASLALCAALVPGLSALADTGDDSSGSGSAAVQAGEPAQAPEGEGAAQADAGEPSAPDAVEASPDAAGAEGAAVSDAPESGEGVPADPASADASSASDAASPSSGSTNVGDASTAPAAGAAQADGASSGSAEAGASSSSTEPGSNASATPAPSAAISTLTSSYALLRANGWIYRCDSEGNPVGNVTVDGKEAHGGYWAGLDSLEGVTTLYVSYSALGLGDFTLSSAKADYLHPRFRYYQEGKDGAPGKWVATRASLSNVTTVEAPVALKSLEHVRFLVNAKNKSSCASIEAGLFANSKVVGVHNLEKTAVTSIGPGTFAGCTALSAINLAGCYTIGAQAFSGCTSLTALALPSATSVGAQAFEGCTALATADLGVCTSIGKKAFFGCTALKSATVTSCITVGASAFQGCTKLAGAKLSAATSVGKSAYAGCTALRSVKIPLCAKIRPKAFFGCTSLKSVSMKKATAIGVSAFEGCTALASAKLTSIKKIGQAAFAGCSSLAAVTLGDSAKSLGGRAFEGTRIKELVLPAKVRSLPADLMGASGSPTVPLKKLVLRSSKLVSIPDSSTFATTRLANLSKSAKIYVPKKLLKKYALDSASNAWRAYKSRFKAMPNMAKAKVNIADVVFNGAKQKPVPTVTYKGKALAAKTNYTLSYSNNKWAGTAKVTITGKGIYYGKKTATFKVNKAPNTLTVQNVTRYVSDAQVKSAATYIYGTPGITGIQGSATYKRLKKSSSCLTVNKKTGAIKVKKGTPDGTYSIKVRVDAKGDSNYAAASATAKINVVVCSAEEAAKHHSSDLFISTAKAEYEAWAAGKTPADKYWSAFDKAPESWCSEFVGWCLRDSGLELGVTMPPNPSYAKAYYNFYKAHPEFAEIHVNDGSYAPRAGDLVLQINNGNPSSFEHTEMIAWSDGYNYRGYAGGWNVRQTSRSLADSNFYYFITLKWAAI